MSKILVTYFSANSNIDIAIVLDDFDDIYECMAKLMGMTWDVDTRIEPHPIRKKITKLYQII